MHALIAMMLETLRRKFNKDLPKGINFLSLLQYLGDHYLMETLKKQG